MAHRDVTNALRKIERVLSKPLDTTMTEVTVTLTQVRDLLIDLDARTGKRDPSKR